MTRDGRRFAPNAATKGAWRAGWLGLLAIAASLLLLPVSASATTLPTTITEDATLTSAGNPYTGESTIASGVTLTIEPGTLLEVTRLNVEGTLKAEGTAEEPVVFTSLGKSPGSWQGIAFEAGSGASVLNYVEAAYGGATSAIGGLVEITGSSPTITNSTFSQSSKAGIRVAEGGSPKIADDTFLDNEGNAIAYSASSGDTGEINIHDNFVEGTNPGVDGIVANYSGATGVTGGTLANNTITGAYRPIELEGADIPGDITGNTAFGNTQNRIWVAGTVAHSSTWSNGGTEIRLGEVNVAAGSTLTITKGLYFADEGRLTVNGTLKAEGSEEEPVVFSGVKEEPGSWQSIAFEAGSGASVLNYVEVAYGGQYSPTTGMIEVNGASPTITNSTFAHSSKTAVYVKEGGAPEIANDVFSSNSGGIYYAAGSTNTGEINIHDNRLEGSGRIAVNSHSATGVVGNTLAGNTVTGATSTPISVNAADIPSDVTENTVAENTENLIKVEGTVAHSATWKDGGSQVRLGEITIAAEATLTVTEGVQAFMTGTKVKVNGTLKAEGSEEEPVVFSGVKEEPGSWQSIAFEAGSGASVLNYVEVAYGGQYSPTTGMIEVNGASPTITNSTFAHSSKAAIKVKESGAPRVEWDRFRSNASGLSYSGTGKLSAPNNDWNHCAGPKPAGCGESVTSNVEWKPAAHLKELNAQCRGKETQCPEGADPVSLATGQLDYSHGDLLLTNKGEVPLEFARTYSSGSEADSGLGPGWAQTGLATASELESGEVLVVRQDGRQDVFKKDEAGYEAPSGVTDTLEKVEGAFRLTTLQGTAYRFDESGRIASITDEHGLETAYAYSSEGRLSTITDPSGQTLTFTYSSSNHITKVKDSTGREVKFAYSSAGDLETVTDALGGVTKYAYDSQHRLTQVTDPRGDVILKNVYNGEGKVVEQEDGLGHLYKIEYGPGEATVTEPDGGERSYGFDSQGRQVSETDQLGHTTTTAYDAAGNVSEVLEPGGAKWAFGHDAAGNLTSVKDPEGGECGYEYDARNHLTGYTDARGDHWSYEWDEAEELAKATDPEGGETAFAYNEAGEPVSVKDPDGHETEFGYDARGNRTSETDPLGHETSLEYSPRNYLTARTLPGLKAEKFERDAYGDMLSRTTPEGHKTKYAYDANGLLTETTDPGEDTWRIERNAMERPTAYVDPLEGETTVTYNGELKPTAVVNRDGAETAYSYNAAGEMTEAKGPEGGDWSYGYDARGNRASVIDPREHETTYEYDLLDRMAKASEPLGATTEYGYDANGDLTSVKDPLGHTTAYAYDKLGRLAEVAQPLGKTTAYGYDGAGNLTSRTTALGTLEYSYDADNRLTEIISGEAPLRSYGYDAAGRETSATDANGHTIEIGYDEDGLPASIEDGRGQSLARSYDSRGLLTKQEDPRGTIEYGYDALGRMTSLTDPQGKALGFAYDPEGALTEVTRPNGVTTASVYDEAGRLAETTSTGGEPPATLESLEYGYDPAGNLVKKLDRRTEAETTYAYDALDRLTEFNPPGEGSTAYGYDAAGNRTEAAGTAYSYNALDQLTESSAGTTYGYDEAGRLTSEANGSEETTYDWEPLEHLAKVTGPGGTDSYAYDGLERLSERKSGEASQVLHYGGLGDMSTYLTSGEGETTRSYVQGAGGLVEQREGETTSFPLVGSHGEVTALAGPEGEVGSRQSYGPWGEALEGPGYEMGYLGAYERPTDPETGLIGMGARSYDPGLGAFLSEDPLRGSPEVPISQNRYPYAWDNPSARYDLSGESVCGTLGEIPLLGGPAKTLCESAPTAQLPGEKSPIEDAEYLGSRSPEFAKALKNFLSELNENFTGAEKLRALASYAVGAAACSIAKASAESGPGGDVVASIAGAICLSAAYGSAIEVGSDLGSR